MASAATTLEVLLRSPLFRRVPLPVVEAVVTAGVTHELAAGKRLDTAGAPDARLFVVLRGALEVQPRAGAAGDRSATLGTGDCAGAEAVVTGTPADAEVIATEDAELLAIDRTDFWMLMDASAEIARNLLGIVATPPASGAGEAPASALACDLERLTTVDALTGLRNRVWLDDMFARQLMRSRADGQPVSLLMIDIDHFKRLNDEHGHGIGDAVLRRAARVLAGGLRPQDLLARYGGEEFAVLLPDADLDTAAAVAHRLRQAVRSIPLERIDERLPRTTVSIGLATAGPADALADLVVGAEQALHRAKDAGRDRVSA